MFRRFLFATAAFSVALAAVVGCRDAAKPKVAAPADDGLKAVKRISVPKDTVATLYAAEPLLANPVCFCFDEQGNLYVAEAFRLNRGTLPTTWTALVGPKKPWLEDELACQTVADRVAMYKKELGKGFPTTTKDRDRVRKLVDTDGDGLPDKTLVFADGFNTPASGLGAGLLAWHGKIWYMCIPDLWQLQDTSGTHKADVKKSLHHGFGVHSAYSGHDMYGLKMGPDGRIYFSIGDSGFHVETDGRVLANPDSGAVLRCNPDGSDLELVAFGLRKPQELTFDKFGNLFTGDNNANSNDRARWVHVVEGGDSGWRIGYLEMDRPVFVGPWNAERIWNIQHAGQHAEIVPPVAYLGNGPSGVTYHPGVTQLPDRYKDHFFLGDCKGNATTTGVHAFELKPRGASFEIVGTPERFVRSSLVSNCDFGPDGGFYLSDWVNRWEMSGKGRIYKVADPSKARDSAVLEVKQILAAGMAKRSAADLLSLLEHADMRVRMEAQFALAERGAALELTKAAARRPDSGHQLARLHGIWGLGMLSRKNPKDTAILGALAALVDDEDTEVCCQAIKALGEARHLESLAAILQQLRATEPRRRFFAALAIGRLGKVDASAAIADMLRDNEDKDPYLRHAGVMALVGSADRENLVRLGQDPSPAVRLASLLAMRRLGMPEVTRFLNNAEPQLVMEAARAIHDQPIEKAMPELAALIGRTDMPDPLAYRVLNANFRLKDKANAEALARFAGRSDVSETLRLEALDCLRTWREPWLLDRVVGLHRPVPARPVAEVADAILAHLGSIFAGPDKVRAEGAKVAAMLGIKEVGAKLLEIAGDTKRPWAGRVDSLRALATLKDSQKDSQLAKAMKLALADADGHVRTEGRRLLVQLQPAGAIDELKKALGSGEPIDLQGAFAILGDLKQPAAAAILDTWLDKLLAKQVPPEAQLDLLEAAAKHHTKAIADKLARHEAGRAVNDHLAKWSETLYGGDAERGKRLFFQVRANASCQECHKIQGSGGDVGPDLTGIGSKQKREYLLESIVEPDKQIAKGYETVVLTLVDGQVRTGILKSENKTEVRLMTHKGTVIVVPVADIDTRSGGPSTMPGNMFDIKSRKDVRDLVEYLASLKEGPG